MFDIFLWCWTFFFFCSMWNVNMRAPSLTVKALTFSSQWPQVCKCERFSQPLHLNLYMCIDWCQCVTESKGVTWLESCNMYLFILFSGILTLSVSWSLHVPHIVCSSSEYYSCQIDPNSLEQSSPSRSHKHNNWPTLNKCNMTPGLFITLSFPFHFI